MLEKLADAASNGNRVTGSVRVEVNALPGVTASVRFRRGTARVVGFK